MLFQNEKIEKKGWIKKLIFLLIIGLCLFYTLNYFGLFAKMYNSIFTNDYQQRKVINEKDDDLSQMVLTGYFSFRDDEISIRGGRDMRDRWNEFPDPETGAEIKMDLFNCAGYLASVKAVGTKFEDIRTDGWKLNLIPDSLASDLREKLQQCGGEPVEKSFSSEFFAVAAKDGIVKNVKTQSPNDAYLFWTLPYRIQWWWDKCDRNLDGNAPTRKIDNWADTDGDGSIDLVEVSGDCKDSCNGDYTCSRILRWTGWRWIEVGYHRPA